MTYKPQDGSGSTITVTQMYKKEPFRVGLMAGMTKSRVFVPDIFFSEQWDQIYYERGYHFSSYLRARGIRITKVPKKIPDDLHVHLNLAVKTGAII